MGYCMTKNDNTDAVMTVTLRDDFYRDGLGKVTFIAFCICVALGVLIMLIIYLHASKPSPVIFVTDKNFRIQAEVPLNQPYLTQPEVLQWVSHAVPTAFNYDFINYAQQLQAAQHFFTADGWRIFINHLNSYANPALIRSNKLFVTGVAAGAPTILNWGNLNGKIAWWVQMPVTISYAGYKPLATAVLTLQILVVRVPTTVNLNGVGIANVIVKEVSNTNPFINSSHSFLGTI